MQPFVAGHRIVRQKIITATAILLTIQIVSIRTLVTTQTFVTLTTVEALQPLMWQVDLAYLGMFKMVRRTSKDQSTVTDSRGLMMPLTQVVYTKEIIRSLSVCTIICIQEVM